MERVSNIHIHSKRANDPDGHKYIPDAFREVAKAQETQFLEFLISQMNKTVQKEKSDSSPLKIYKSMLNSERAKKMADVQNGLGIKKIILDQIYPQNKRTKAMYDYYQNLSKKMQAMNNLKAYAKEALNGR